MTFIVVIAAVIRKNRKVLIARRAEGEYLAGLRECQGGKIERGETPGACLKREPFEKSGINFRVGRFIAES